MVPSSPAAPSRVIARGPLGSNALWTKVVPGNVSDRSKSGHPYGLIQPTLYDTADGRSANRRIRIVILPKLDQFYGMIEEGLKMAAGK